MFGKCKGEKLMAAALYGGLSEKEEARMAAYFARHPEARAEFDALHNLVQKIPAETFEPPIDLLPGVRARLHDASPRRLRRALPVAAGMAIAAAALVAALLPQAPAGYEPAPASALLGHLAEADALAYQEQFGTAAEVLRTALASWPSDPMADRAEARLAELAARQQDAAEHYFEDLRRYPSAYEAYRTLQRSFPEAFAAQAQNAVRLDLLDEARQVRYASLERLDAARRGRTGVVEALEQVMAAYPSAPGSTAPSRVAELAAEEIVRHLAESDAAGGPEPRLRALEAARSRCTHPLALAHVEVALGRYYLERRGDAAEARRWGEQALERADPAGIALAQAFLDKLGRGDSAAAP